METPLSLDGQRLCVWPRRRRRLEAGKKRLRNLANLLVHLFGRDDEMERVYLSVVHDRCLLCEEPISESPAYLTYKVCPYCRFHYTLSARERIDLLADKGTFKETHKYVSSVAPLSFSRRGPYRKLISQTQNRTGLTEAAVTGRCRIDGIEDRHLPRLRPHHKLHRRDGCRLSRGFDALLRDA